MKVKIALVNDRIWPMKLQVQDLGQPNSWTHRQYVLDPSQSKIIEIDIPEDHIPYFKIWETGAAFLSSIKSDIESS